MRLVCVCFLLMVMGSSTPSAQTVQEVSLTLESFRHLTPQQGARQLIGPSAELVSKMIVGRPPPFCCKSLDFVRLYLKPIAVRAGLCMQNEVDVFLHPADGSSPSTAEPSTVMKIANINLVHEFAAVGDLAGQSTPDEKTAVAAKCGELHPFTFFAAESSDEAWEAAYLAELALQQAASDGAGKTRINCRLPGPACATAYDRLIKLSAANVGSVRRDCGGPTQGTAVCYFAALRDGPVDWTINIEASRDATGRTAPKFNLKSTSFEISLRPVF